MLLRTAYPAREEGAADLSSRQKRRPCPYVTRKLGDTPVKAPAGAVSIGPFAISLQHRKARCDACEGPDGRSEALLLCAPL